MARVTRDAACAYLRWAQVPVGEDFHALPSKKVENLLLIADRLKYRKPKNANGSRGRYFHALLQRKCR